METHIQKRSRPGRGGFWLVIETGPACNVDMLLDDLKAIGWSIASDYIWEAEFRPFDDDRRDGWREITVVAAPGLRVWSEENEPVVRSRVDAVLARHGHPNVVCRDVEVASTRISELAAIS